MYRLGKGIVDKCALCMQPVTAHCDCCLHPWDRDPPRSDGMMEETIASMREVRVHPLDVELWFFLADKDVDGPERWLNFAEDLCDKAADLEHARLYGG
jgi:hypothetical protein